MYNLLSIFPKWLRPLLFWMQPIILHQIQATQSSIVGSGGQVTIKVDPPDVVGAAALNKLAQAAAATILTLAQIVIAKENREFERDEVLKVRTFLERLWLLHRDQSMGGQETTARTNYATYIGQLAGRGDFSALMAEHDTHFNRLSGAILDSDTLLNDLYSKALLGERQSNLSTLRAEEVVDADAESTKRRTSVVNVNTQSTAVARAREDGIILAHKEESSRINSEEAKRGYVGGDGFRDKLLTTIRTKQQDDIAVLKEGTELENVSRTETLEDSLATRDFNLSQNNRQGRFNINEADVEKRLQGINEAAKKIVVNDDAKILQPQKVANEALNLRHDKEIFRQEAGYPTSSVRPTGESTKAIAAAALGNLASDLIRLGTAPKESGFGF